MMVVSVDDDPRDRDFARRSLQMMLRHSLTDQREKLSKLSLAFILIPSSKKTKCDA